MLQLQGRQRIILISKIICFSSVLFLMLTSFGYREPDYCRIADRIVNNYEKEFAKPRGLKLHGYGGAMMDDIQKITLCFSSLDVVDIEQARKLYVEMMEEILCRINSHKNIHPFLHTFPFDRDNIELSISFKDSNAKRIGDGHVALMFIARDGIIFYEAYNNDKKEFYGLYEENYAEALKIVHNTK